MTMTTQGETVTLQNPDASTVTVRATDSNESTEAVDAPRDGKQQPPQSQPQLSSSSSSTSSAPSSATPLLQSPSVIHNNNNNSMHNSNGVIKTPPRHSYAADTHLTPIASIKRPRNTTMARSNSGVSTSSASSSQTHLPASTTTSTSTSTTLHRSPMSVSHATPHRSQSTRSMSSAESPLSPMHGPKAVEDKVDEIFSPAAHFLNDHSIEDDGDANHTVNDDTMESSPHHTSTTTTTTPHQSTTTTTNNNNGNVSDDDDDDVSMTRPEQPMDSDEFNPWQFIQMLPPYDSVRHTRPPVTLPPNTTTFRQSLVLDLDETLVHCSVDAPPDDAPPADFTFPVAFHGVTYTVHVRRRPGLQAFLEAVSAKFEVILFTASQKVYADALLDILDPEHKYFHHRLFRESCLAVEGNFLKDLTVTGRDLATTVLVDNSPHAFGYQVDNGIPIESWFDCPEDTELAKLTRFLRRHILPARDVREPVRHKFRSHQLVASAPPML